MHGIRERETGGETNKKQKAQDVVSVNLDLLTLKWESPKQRWLKARGLCLKPRNLNWWPELCRKWRVLKIMWGWQNIREKRLLIEGQLTQIEVSPYVPSSRAKTTNRRFTVVSGATSGETMPETFKAPNNHPGVQSRICLPTPLWRSDFPHPDNTSIQDALGHVWRSDWLFC